MQQMAEAMNQAAKAMQEGDGSQAADALEQMADQLGEMQQEMAELEDLQSAMDQIVRKHAILRTKFVGGPNEPQQIIEPFDPGTNFELSISVGIGISEISGS